MRKITPAIVLYSPDMEKLVKFYSRLGFQFKKEKHGSGPEHFACGFDGMAIEIYPRSGRVSDTDRLRAMDYRMVIPVEDMTEALRCVSRLSKKLVSSKKTEIGMSALIEDPDGRYVLLIEHQV